VALESSFCFVVVGCMAAGSENAAVPSAVAGSQVAAVQWQVLKLMQ
jgi:hypothetical protein